MSNRDQVKELCLPLKDPLVVALVGGTHLWMPKKAYNALVKVLNESYYWDGEKCRRFCPCFC